MTSAPRLRRHWRSPGSDVAISYIGHTEGAAATASAIQAAGRTSAVVALDQRDPASIDAGVAQVIERFGRLDILVNNAGWNIGIPFPDLDALTADIWNRVHETNLRGPFLLSRACAPHLKQHGAGTIVEHRVGRRPVAGKQQHRLLREQGRLDPPDPLPRRRARTGRDGELRRARTGRGHAAGEASARSRRRRRPAASGAGPHRQRGRHRGSGRDLLPSRSVTGQVMVVDGGMPVGMR